MRENSHADIWERTSLSFKGKTLRQEHVWCFKELGRSPCGWSVMDKGEGEGGEDRKQRGGGVSEGMRDRGVLSWGK